MQLFEVHALFWDEYGDDLICFPVVEKGVDEVPVIGEKGGCSYLRSMPSFWTNTVMT